MKKLLIKLLLETEPSFAHGDSSQAKVYPFAARAEEVPSFLRCFKTLDIVMAPGVEPANSRSAGQRSTDWAGSRPLFAEQER